MTIHTHTRSVWMDSADLPSHAPLAAPAEADVCVVGAGIAGLTTALLLLRAGRSVIVLDADGVGAGETARTTAHFAAPDDRYYCLAQRFGAEQAALAAQSYLRATDLAESIAASEDIDCDFTRLDGYLMLARDDDPDVLEREFDAARAAGVPVSRLARVAGLPFDSGPALCFGRQARMHPLRYLAGVARAIERQGGRICGGTRATLIGEDGARRVVMTDQGSVRAASVVVATNTPFHERVAVHIKQSGYMTYVIGLRVAPGSVPDLLLWDTGDPYFYVRLMGSRGRGDDLLIVGGQDHKCGQDSLPQHRFAEIEQWARLRFPLAQEVTHRWSGEVMEPADGMAYAGRSPGEDSVYLITGDSGNGMTHCTAGAMIVHDLILGIPNPWAALYDPARKAVHGLGEFVSAQADVASRYADWLKAGEVADETLIAPGSGALVRHGASLQAVYRSEDGELHCCSAKCPHLGCVVHWNALEGSWDCPCHGSRFDTEGRVLHGPAHSPLTR